jgi:hypothetical protein
MTNGFSKNGQSFENIFKEVKFQKLDFFLNYCFVSK